VAPPSTPPLLLDHPPGTAADRELAAAHILTEGLLNGVVALMVATAPPGHPPTIFYANDATLRLTGYAAADLLGQPCDFLRGPDTSAETMRRCAHALATDGFCDLEVLNYRRDGTPFWNAVTVIPAPTAAPGARGFLMFMRDVTDRRRADDRVAALAERLHVLAMSDPLTGIANRRQFDAMLHREWHRAVRAQSRLTLAMIDIDHFKSYNDQFGHPAGDACLRAVAAALDSVIRQPTDFLARYGGEEFAVLLPDIDAQTAAQMADRLVQAIRTAAIAHPRHDAGHITISCGIVTAQPARTPSGAAQFVDAADRALYQAKSAGRDRAHQADEVA
jgi:diguanylate cyclase (GGDEF)-like protein/PAS domain S-box-containing protein